MLIGVLALASLLTLVIVGTALLGGNDEGVSADTTPLTPPAAGGLVRDKTIGATVRKPRRWSHRRTGRTLSLRSPDKTVIISISRPSGTDRSAAVLQSGVEAVRRQYRSVRVIGSVNRKVARLPTNSVVMSARNARGTALRVLTSAPQGRTRSWLVQVFSAAGTPAKRLAEAQVALGTLRLMG